MSIKPQGKTATFTGNLEEGRAIRYLETLGYLAVDQIGRKNSLAWVRSGRDISEWCRANAASDALFFKAHPTINNMYGVEWKIDLTIWHRTMWPVCLFVEIKTQTTSGSCDSKIPYVVQGLKQQNRPTGLLLNGNGWCKGLIPWIESQQTEKFLMWKNALKFRDYVETGKNIPSNTVAKTIVTKAQGDLYDPA